MYGSVMVAAAAAVYHYYYSIVTYYRGASELTVLLLILYRTTPKPVPLSPRAAHCLGRPLFNIIRSQQPCNIGV